MQDLDNSLLSGDFKLGQLQKKGLGNLVVAVSTPLLLN